MKTKSNLFKFFTVALLALWGAVSCVDDISDVLAPQLEIAEEQQQVLFPGDGGVQAIDIAANCEWSVTESSIPTWVSITPTSGNGAGQIVISVPEATSERSATISFELIHPDYGRWGKAETMLYIHQYPGDVDPDFEEQLIFYNDFDKEPATQTFGSGTSWPYLDQSDCWQNQMGIGAGDVTYAYSGLSARNNSNSDSNYSDYAGSGTNNLFFGANGALTIEKIDVSASNKLKLTFGSEKYLQSGDSTFNPAEFQVTLSNDGENWSDPIAYSFPSSFKSGRWDLATANFEIPEGTKTLYIKFAATVASAYRLDDVKLTTGMGGPKIEFSGNGGGGETPDPTPGDGTAIYANNFDKELSSKSYGSSNNSWPYLDQFEGWKNHTGTGVANVDYKFNAMSTRNGSGSNSSNSSQYTGSDGNFLFFGAVGNYFTIEKIDVSSANKLQLTFGAEKYGQGIDNTFSHKEFTVVLSNDGENWSDPITFSFPNGDPVGKFDLATANFTIPEGTKTLYIKFAASVASVYRMDDVTLTAGNGGQQIEFANGGGGETPDPTPGDYVGEGSKDKPYTISDLMKIYSAGGTTASVWITGTIVGSCTGQSFDDSFTDATGSSASNTNIVIATDGTKVPVQLPNNGSREALSLQNNPSHLGKKVVVYGTIEKYFGVAGIKNVSDYVIDGQSGGETPDPTPGGDDDSQATTTIDAIVKQCPATAGQSVTLGSNLIVEGIVVSSADLNNLTSKKTAYVQDDKGGVQVYFAANHSFAFGTKVRLDLSGQKLTNYNGAPEIDGLPLDKATQLSTGNTVTAKAISIDSFLTNAYYGQYVELSDVQVKSTDAQTWGGSSHTSIEFETKSGKSFMVFSSSYATYKSETVPTGSGKLKGIASVNNGTYQLIFATSSDWAGLTGARFTPGEGGGTVDPTPDPDPTPGPGTDPTPGDTTTTTLTMSDYLEGGEVITDTDGKTYTFGDFDFTFTKVNSNDSNFNANDGGVRLYKSDIVKIDGKGKKISKIVFNTYGGASYCTNMGADSGTATADTAASTITWTGSAVGSVTLTAINSQIRFKTIEITWE